MSTETPGVSTAKVLLDRYGLGTLFAANVLGAGSVYILAQTGATAGFALLWVLPVAFALDMVMHDMSGRMARHDRPLMGHIDNVLRDFFGQEDGRMFSVIFAVVMALVMQLWAVANYAVAGYAVSWFLGVNPTLLILVVAGIAAGLIWTGTYTQVEAMIGALVVVVFAAYSTLLFGAGAPPGEVLSGFVPSLLEPTLVIAMLGTTVYYPNFFIQTSMRSTKGWVDLSKWRRDNAAGIGFAVIVSAAMLGVAAVALEPGEVTLTSPAQPLVDMVGAWTLPLFMVAVVAASFTSATGTLFGSGFAVPQSMGMDTHFGDSAFRKTVIGLIGISSVLSVLVLEFTAMTPVRMAITMPALNGAIFLPVTIVALYHATHHLMGRKQKMISLLGVVIMCLGSLLTIQSLLTTIGGWL